MNYSLRTRRPTIKIIAVIPARYKSTRFPGKPLAEIQEKPLIWWVYRQARKVTEFEEVYVATDDLRIKSACEKLDIPVLMTSREHRTGTDRVAEAAEKLEADLYLNIQGDEPLVDPDVIRSAIIPFQQRPKHTCVSNLMTQVVRMSDLSDSTVPKVVCNAKKEALFFSRLPIPYPKDPRPLKYYKQVCVYGFTKKSLLAFSKLPRGVIEMVEDIEILRFIENNIPVQMVEVHKDTIAVDTPSDLEMVRTILSRDAKQQ